MSQLPPTRQLKNLGSLLDVQAGFAFDSKNFSEKVGFPLIRIRDIKNSYTETKYIGVYKEEFIVYKGDFLIGMDGSFGCYIRQGENALLNQRVCRLINPDKELYLRYIFYGINNFLKEIEDNTSFVTVKHISARQIKEIEFPVPPLQVQQDIVKILDEANIYISDSKKAIQSQINELDKMRQSTLSEVFENKEWGKYKIGKTFKIKSGNFLPNRLMVENGKIDVYGGNGINGKHNDNNLDGENIVIGRVGAQCGNVRLVKGKIRLTDNAFYISEYLIDNINKQYLERFLSYIDLGKTSNSSAQPVISYKSIEDIEIPLPPLPIQQDIVKKLDDLSQNISNIKNLYKSQLTHYDELWASILDQAFRGELIS